MKHTLALFTGLLLSTAFTLTTQATTLSFEDTVVTGDVEYLPTNHYQFAGIIFDGLIPVENLQIAEPFNYAEFLANGGSSPNVLALTPTLGPDLDIVGSFVLPGTLIPAVTDFVQVDVFDTETGTSMGTLEAYDEFNGLLESVQMTTPAGGGGVYTISQPGIAHIRFVQDNDGGNFDNLTFNSPIPELSRALLSLVGIAAIGLRRRRG